MRDAQPSIARGRNKRRLAGAVVLGAALLLVGCEDRTAPQSQYALTKSEKRTLSLYDFTEQFGGFILHEDYASAWNMTSTHLRKRMDVQQFTAAHEAARQEYGKPLDVDVDMSSTGDDKYLLSEDLNGFDRDVPKEIREARMIVILGTEVDQLGDFLKCYDCWVNIVREDDEYKISGFNYTPCE